MKIKKLAIENFGVYRDRHVFDLEVPTSNKTNKKNVIIVRGANGAGKSTFYKAISLALFGRLAVGDTISNKEYKEYIKSKIHKNRDHNDNSFKKDVIIFEIWFEYVESGIEKNIYVKRTLNLKSLEFEKLKILVDDIPPGVQEMDYQNWLSDLLPAGLMNIIFFDAEDMKTILNSRENEDLKNFIKKMLGIQLVNKLDADLSYYLNVRTNGSDYDKLREQVIEYQNLIDDLEKEISEYQNSLNVLEDDEKTISANIQRYERELASEGGDYAARRPLIKDRIAQLDEQIIKLEGELRELSHGLLPFSFAPLLTRKLKSRLQKELNSTRHEVAFDYLKNNLALITKNLEKSEIWEKHNIQKNVSNKIINEFKTRISEVFDRDEADKIIHNLSDNEVIKLLQWIQDASITIPKLASHVSNELKERKIERSKHQDYLNRAPNEATIEPIFEKIRDQENDLVSLRKEMKRLTEAIATLEYRKSLEIGKQETIKDKLLELEKDHRKYSMAQRSKFVLDAYSKKFTALQINNLNDHVVQCFNRICDKQHLLSSAEYDPYSFDVTLIDKKGEELMVRDFSMGESQIYGLSLLWALRNISGYNLPLLIDTPVARLDQSHQSNFVFEFLPDVSEQVILFTTNVEMSNNFEKDVNQITLKTYNLLFDENTGQTMVDGIGHEYHKKCESIEV